MKRTFFQILNSAGALVSVLIALFALPVHGFADSGQVSSADCLGCHDGYDRSLARGPHILGAEVKAPAISLQCTSCHSGSEQHVGDPTAESIGNPARLAGRDAVEACGTCHLPHQQLDDYGYDIHSSQQTNCASCHKVHNTTASRLLDEGAGFCLTCHTATKVSFMKRSNHPVQQGTMTCLSCHRFSRRTDQNYTFGDDRMCQSCHPEQSGPFPYEHAASNSSDVNGGACIECHNPHGSDNDRLLKQPVNQICLQCHSVPKHQQSVQHGAAWAKIDCVVCHTGTHGSFADRRLLDENLPALLGGANCYCHYTVR